MNIKDIKALAEIMSQNSLSLIDIDENGTKIKLEKAPMAVAVAPYPVATPVENIQVAEVASQEEPAGKIITSPTVGVFYSSSSPDTAPYVTMGSSVKVGDVLCIIEAMKLMNEITADCSGEIAEILIGNGQVVEYGQPLFRIVEN